MLPGGNLYAKNDIPVPISNSESVTNVESAGRTMTRPFLGVYGLTRLGFTRS